MKINVAEVRQSLRSFDFKTLFREHLGWDNYQSTLNIPLNGNIYRLTAIAEKRGFVAFICDDNIPERAVRMKIDQQVTKSVREHFVIYADESAGQQIWQWVRREPGKPLSNRDHRFDLKQSGAGLIQRLEQIAVTLDEEEEIDLPGISGRARAAFDVDRVTKRFFDRFKSEHTAFLRFVKGIKAEADLQWYTSLMLNRLMFVYFIQKKGFLDGDTDYLRNRLKMVQQARGKDKFQSFYRYFLLKLFHDGLGRPPAERKFDPVLEKILGEVPFLNGGFFEVHDLERRYAEIDIPDEAFGNLFDFFDQYRWHLDERPLRADNEINPDVVGYIFEKYINQKQMGAYYTKEDITEYISKNTVIPFLFDAAQKKCAIAFNKGGALWRLLRENPERYIYSAMKQGVIHENGQIVPESELPDYVQTGMRDPKARMHDERYNLQQAPAGDPIRLVTETWREYVNRRNRCLEIRDKLKRGKVCEINDLITLNLDIWQFARDAVINAEEPELLRAFWTAIEKITILDPTCGSGAFLFAGLRILETLYSDCLERMGRFVEDLEDKPHHPEQFSDFKKVLAQIAKHPNERYFILKSIIINNLFGVDIMEEAVEICKLRLFLKLVAQVETVGQIEPLPDIDFNIRVGNTLVGYATADHVRQAFTEEKQSELQTQQKLLLADDEDSYRSFEESAEMVERAFQLFRNQQTTHGGKVSWNDKQELRKRLAKLDEHLDVYLAGEYGINVKKRKEFEAWKASHQPFHWFVEFYGIMRDGGFDVILGNPPYVELSRIRDYHLLAQYQTTACGNIYTVVCERSYQLIKSKGHFGMIVPLSSVATDRMSSLRNAWISANFSTYLSHYSGDAHPSVLFNGVKFRLTILLQTKNSLFEIFSTHYQRWYAEAREFLFPQITYEPVRKDHIRHTLIPKVGSSIHDQVLRRLSSEGIRLAQAFMGKSNHPVYCHRIVAHFVKAFDFVPYFMSERDGIKKSEDYKIFSVGNKPEQSTLVALLNSNLFYCWFVAYSDVYHCGKEIILDFPICLERLTKAHGYEFDLIVNRLMKDLKANSVRRQIPYKMTGLVTYDEFYPRKSKFIIDEIDRILATYYNFTEEELEFIINYDIKYRMGGAEIADDD